MPVCQKTLGESQRERPEAGRGWRTRHRDPILIHAAKPTGVAVVDLVDCVPLAEVGGEPYRGCHPARVNMVAKPPSYPHTSFRRPY